MKVLVLWSPILAADNHQAAMRASAYLTDPRVEHFWDLWSYGLKTYTPLFHYPQGKIAWDIFVFYKPHQLWKQSTPQPVAWLQSHNIVKAPQYSKEALTQELKKLLQ